LPQDKGTNWIALENAVKQLSCFIDAPNKVTLKLWDFNNTFLNFRDEVKIFFRVGFGLFKVHQIFPLFFFTHIVLLTGPSRIRNQDGKSDVDFVDNQV